MRFCIFLLKKLIFEIIVGVLSIQTYINTCLCFLKSSSFAKMSANPFALLANYNSDSDVDPDYVSDGDSTGSTGSGEVRFDLRSMQQVAGQLENATNDMNSFKFAPTDASIQAAEARLEQYNDLLDAAKQKDFARCLDLGTFEAEIAQFIHDLEAVKKHKQRLRDQNDGWTNTALQKQKKKAAAKKKKMKQFQADVAKILGGGVVVFEIRHAGGKMYLDCDFVSMEEQRKGNPPIVTLETREPYIKGDSAELDDDEDPFCDIELDRMMLGMNFSKTDDGRVSITHLMNKPFFNLTCPMSLVNHLRGKSIHEGKTGIEALKKGGLDHHLDDNNVLSETGLEELAVQAWKGATLGTKNGKPWLMGEGLAQCRRKDSTNCKKGYLATTIHF